MRVTGAQRLAAAGVTEAKLILFGRRASKAFLKYVREALLGKQGGAWRWRWKASCAKAVRWRHCERDTDLSTTAGKRWRTNS